MSSLESALAAVKQGIGLEESDERIENVIIAYQKAIAHFSQAIQTNELKNQEFQQELKDQLEFYMQKVETLKSETMQHKKDIVETSENDDLVNRIKSTVLIETPSARFDDVAGLNDVKHALHQAVVMPIRHPELFSENLSPYKGFLLFGPPGTGKTHLARAVAGEARGTSFFSVSASDLVSKYQGESENLVKSLFQAARRLKPSIIFIDEVDSLAMARSDSDQDGTRRIKTELFVQMQGTNANNEGVFVMAATNTPFSLDEAFLRRFDKLLYIPLPDKTARIELFRMEFNDCAGISEDVIQEASAISEGLSGSDIEILGRKVKMGAISKLEMFTHFKKTEKNGKNFWKPCKATTKGATKMHLDNIPPNSLDYVPEFKKEEVLQCVRNAKSRTDHSTISRLEKFAEEKAEWIKPLPTNCNQRKESRISKMFSNILNFW